MSTNTLVVRALDVGYGNTKFTMLVSGGEIQCDIFPSIAVTGSAGPDLSAGLMQRRNTILVDVNGVKYEVGKDAHLAQDASHGRVLDPGYPMTDVYMALIRGAMYYMGQRTLDLLILGLPVNTYSRYAALLAEKVVGQHPVPFRDGDQIVEVKNCRVVPQPIGALFDYSTRTRTYDRVRLQTNLLVDVGFYTMDWLYTNGVKMVTTRSGAHNGGMSAILQGIAGAIGREIGEQIDDLLLVEEALRTGTAPLIYGKPYDITEHLKQAKSKAEQYIAVMMNNVGSTVGISNVILAGGGAAFFKDILQDKFPNHEIITATDPVFANARGFQRAGQQFADNRS